MSRQRIFFCALGAYSLVGGIETFNRRVVDVIARRSESHRESRAEVALLVDDPAYLPTISNCRISAFSSRKIVFVLFSVYMATRSSVLILGHVNLLPIALLAKILNPALRSIMFVHGIEVWDKAEYRKRRWYDRLALMTINTIVSVSKFTAVEMAGKYGVPLEKFVILPNAVDIPSRQELKDEVAPPIERKIVNPTVLTVTRLGPSEGEKNVKQAIEAFATLTNRFPDAIYNIVGDGSLREELQTLAKQLNVSDKVKFCGKVTQAKLEELYREATVFVLLSSKEGFGIVFLEAWLNGLPVICGNQSAPREFVDDGVSGFVVEPDNIEQVAGRIAFVFTHPVEAKAMGKSGLQKVMANYSAVTFEKRLQRIIDDVADEPAFMSDDAN